MSSDAQQIGYLHPPEERVAAAIEALPKDVKDLIEKPGPTSERINHAINWAARPDAAVLREHQARDKGVHEFADIRSATLKHKDAVAEHFAAQYRHRALLTGAVTALPGGLWAIPAIGLDVQLTAIFAVRMASKVAQSYGYDTSLLQEQAHLADVLALMAGVDSLRGVGNWLTREGLTEFLPRVLPRLLGRLSLKLTEEETAKLIGRIIPGVAAVIGGTVDYGFMRIAGERAIAYYHNRYVDEQNLLTAAPTQAALPPGHAPQVVEGSLVAPTLAIAAPSGVPTNGASISSSGSTSQAVAAQAAQPIPAAPLPPLSRKHRKPPERYALYTAIWAIIVLLVTVGACFAVGVIAYSFISGHAIPNPFVG
jgi:hypothetical protein